MGNHDVGRSLAAAAAGFWEGRTHASKDEALRFLDKVAEPWRGADAEFDDELFDGIATDLGRLVAIAMGAKGEELSGVEDEATGACPWYDGPYQRFRERYKFC